ncbi:MAG: hypothetical protein RMJ88_09600 [Thermogemmata sp.]|nr:hypothetical protein [Thermogemmata sp.]
MRSAGPVLKPMLSGAAAPTRQRAVSGSDAKGSAVLGPPLDTSGLGRRPAYTLLELLVATLIGSFLLGGLYLAFYMTLTQTQISREMAQTEDLARGVFNRIALDLGQSLGPLPPKLANAASGAGGSSGSSATSGSGDSTSGNSSSTSGATNSNNADATTTGDSLSTDPTTSGTTTNSAANSPLLPFHAGIFGYDDDPPRLVIFASRVPTALSTPGVLLGSTVVESQQTADLRRIVYWRGANGGLCREERSWVTADQIGNSTYPDRSNEESALVAEHIVDVLFEYYDGSSWSTTWDGSGLSATGSGMAGPPRAIRITLTFELTDPQRPQEPLYRTISQVIPIRTAPGNATVTLVDPVVPSGVPTTPDDGSGGTTGGDDTTGGSSSGSTGGATGKGSAGAGTGKGTGKSGSAGIGRCWGGAVVQAAAEPGVVVWAVAAVAEPELAVVEAAAEPEVVGWGGGGLGGGPSGVRGGGGR